MQEMEQSKVEQLINSINNLSNTINHLRTKINTETEKQTQSDKILAQKINNLTEQHEKIAEALTLLLELHQKHLPKIEKNTKETPKPKEPIKTRKRQLPPFEF